jgi:hypothetical protein
MIPEGCISGRVVDGNGLLQPQTAVYVNDAVASLPSWWGCDTDNNGAYVVCQLPAGSYKVRCAGNNAVMGSIWVDVAAGTATSGVTCTLGLNLLALAGETASLSPQTTISVGPGVFTDVVTTIYTPHLIIPIGDMRNVGVFYELGAAYAGNHQPARPQPGQHYTVRVNYQQEYVPTDINEAGLAVYYWNGSAWIRELSSFVDVVANTVTASPNHFSLWAVLYREGGVYLPILFKKG